MVFSDPLYFKKELLLSVLAGQMLLFWLGIPSVLTGQPQQFISDSLHAERLLDQGLSMRDSAKYVRSNALLTAAATLFLKSDHPYKSAHCYNYISDNFQISDKLDSAEVYARKALSIVNRLASEDPTERIRAYVNLGMVEAVRAHYDKSLNWLQKSHRLMNLPNVGSSSKFWVLSSLGYVHDDLGNYDKALAFYYEALDILKTVEEPAKAKRAKLYNNIGYTYSNKGQYDRAQKFYKKNLDLNLEIQGDMHPNVAMAYLNIGAAFWRQGDYGQALLYFQKSLKISLAVYGEEHEITLINYENIALCYLKAGKFDKAIADLKRAVKIKKSMLRPNHPDIAISYKNIGTTYFMQDHFRQALFYYQKALAIQLNSLSNQHPDLVATYNKIALTFAEQNLPDSSFKYLNKAQTVARKTLGSDHPALAYMYAAMAKASAKSNRYRQAISYYQQALHILSDGFDATNLFDNPRISEIRYHVYAVDILFDKAKMLHSAYSDIADTAYLKASLSTFDLISELLDNLQAGYVNTQSKFAVGRKGHNIYEHAINVAYDLYYKEKNSFYLERIFYYAEKSKARVMLESVVAQGAKRYANIPDSLLNYENVLEENINTVRQQMNLIVDRASAKNGRLASLRDSLLFLNKQLARHTNMLEKQYPRYHALKYANHIPSAREVQNQLSKKDLVVLEYFWGKKSLFAVIMTEDSLAVQKLPFDAQLADHIRKFNYSVTHRSDSSYRALGYQLYRTLIEPVETFIPASKQVLIVPDRELTLLPFEALLTHRDSTSIISYQDLPYLLRDYDIAYAPSVVLTTFSQPHENHSYDIDFLAFAPAFTAGIPLWPDQTGIVSRSAWNPLPFSKKEVINIASLFETYSGFWSQFFSFDNTKVLLDQKASEGMLKSMPVLDAKYIHLATHAFAFISEDRPELAGILLYPGASLKEDGILFAREIYNLSMNADLVVLSACETGRGSVIKGEGIMSLSRAFRYAGAENLLVSLWKVGDRSSARLMVEFYGRLMNGKNKIRALQEAKKNLIEKTKYAHPFYWAPFILIGQ